MGVPCFVCATCYKYCTAVHLQRCGHRCSTQRNKHSTVRRGAVVVKDTSGARHINCHSSNNYSAKAAKLESGSCHVATR